MFSVDGLQKVTWVEGSWAAFTRDSQDHKVGWLGSLRRLSLVSSREFRCLIMAEISRSLACAQHRGLVYSSECLRGLSGGPARCVCNLLYDLFAWDASPERQQCWGRLVATCSQSSILGQEPCRTQSRAGDPSGRHLQGGWDSPLRRSVSKAGSQCGVRTPQTP